MWNKYCKMMHPVIVSNLGASHAGKSMIKVRDEIEHDIWWQVGSSNSSFWFDNGTKMGALYHIEDQLEIHKDIEVKDFIINGTWKKVILEECISAEMVEYIINNIKPASKERGDRLWWMGEVNGKFYVKFAYRILRSRRETQT